MVIRRNIKTKKKATRISKMAERAADLNAYGTEPSWKIGQVPTQSERAKALTWYNVLTDRHELYEFATLWLERKGHRDVIAEIKSLPNQQKYVLKYLPRTACALARMEDLGACVEADEFILTKFRESVEMMRRDHLGDAVDDEAEVAPAPVDPQEAAETAQADAFQSRIRARVVGVKDHLEDKLIDGLYVGFDVYEFLKANNYPIALATKLEQRLQPIAEDYEFAIRTGEGFGNIPKKVLKDKMGFVSRAIDDLRRYASNEKKLKAPRKKKPVSIEKKLRDFRYKKEDADLKVASVNPADVIGARELWHYDTRGNTITVLRSEKGLDVHRTTITGWDPDSSFTKKGGRRPDKWIERARSDGKASLRRLMDDINKDALTQPRDRINDNTLLLRVIK
jgi:hypothetical protein